MVFVSSSVLTRRADLTEKKVSTKPKHHNIKCTTG